MTSPPGAVAHDHLHLIGKLDLQVTVSDADMAHALRPRLETLGQRLMPGVIEQVLDAVLPADACLRLDRLDIDLGRLLPEHLEQDALHALAQALGDALAHALHTARQGRGQGAELLSAPESLMAWMTAYLLSGTLPFARLSQPFDASARLMELVAQHADAFTAWLRRHAHERHVLTRLVWQADADILRALLAMLAPADAAVIQALLADVLVVHARTQLPRPSSQSALERLLWVATLEFLLAGSPPFHRVRYLGHLLEREAERMGFDYGDLLRILSATVALTQQRMALHSAMPLALAQLVAELGPSPAPAARDFAAAPEGCWVQALAAARRGWFEPLFSRVRGVTVWPDRLEDVARSMGEGLLVQMLHAYAPGEAAGVLEDLAAHRTRSRSQHAEWLLWACVLRRIAAAPAAGPGRAVLRVHWQAALARRADDPWLNLRQWLHTGVAMVPQALQPSPVEYLLQLPAPRIRRLLLSSNAEHTRMRLRRVMAALKPAQQGMLLDKLDVQGAGQRAALMPALKTLGQASRLAWMLQAADAALAGLPCPQVPCYAQPVHALPAQTAEDKATAARQELMDGLDAGRPLQAAQLRQWSAWMEAEDAPLLNYFEARRGLPQAHARWARALPPSALLRLLASWQPALAPALRTALPLMQQAWRDTASFAVRRRIGPALWRELLDLLCARRAPDMGDLMEALIDGWSAGQAPQAAKMRSRAVQLARRGGHGHLAALLRGETKAASASPRKPAAPAPVADDEHRRALYVGNAGLVLFYPYLPLLFERLGLLTPDGEGVARVQGEEEASRACHLLQYLADGRLDQSETLLPLNKLLAGMPLSQPVARVHEACADDLAVCDDLMRAVADRWPALNGTTPDVLRETFLRREGRLARKGEAWTLHVQRKTVDVLVDLCPWPFSLVYHPWMPAPIHVTW